MWEASVALSHAIAHKVIDVDVEDKTVLSLGCGAVPLVAMTCASLGAKESVGRCKGISSCGLSL